MGPLQETKPWNTSGVEGVYRFLGRVWRLFVDEKSYEEFEQKQRDRRRNVTRVVQEKSDECRKYFKMGIDTVLNRLRAKINEQTEEEDKKNEYIKKTDEVQQPR